ncbi:MAG: uroporphyrinogen-III synthase [Novosphingobium sp.]|nr:uroporphyrinogen-III synthase [Novosphingobium sp.]
MIRPEPGNAATCAAAREHGVEALAFPLFSIEPLPWHVPEGPFDAILAGSANVFRHGGEGLDVVRHIPVIAVGATTAAAAQERGFDVRTIGEGGLQPIVASLPPGNYIRIAGQDRVTLNPPPGVRIATTVAYAARRSPLSGALAHILRGGATVLLHSGEAARHFAAECDNLDITKGSIHLACLAPRIADMAGQGWARVATAPQRTDAMLLELGLRLCQTV